MSTEKGFIKSSAFSIGCSLAASIIFSLFNSVSSNTQFIDAIQLHLQNNYLIYILMNNTVVVLGGIASSLIPKFRQMDNLSAMARFACLSNVFKNTGGNDNNYSKFKSDLQKSCKNQKEISIISATGHSTFCGADSLLGDSLKTIKQRINIFLLDPSIGCKATEIRAVSIGKSRNELRNNIVKSISYIKNIKKTYPWLQVKIYLYNFPPNFGIICSGNSVWVQYYGNRSNINSSPVFGFQKTSVSHDPEGLYCFFNEFVDNQQVNYDNSHQSLNGSIKPIQDLDSWRYPGDLRDLMIDNIQPCNRKSGIACRRHSNCTNQEISKNHRLVGLKDRRGFDVNVLKFIEMQGFFKSSTF